MVGGIIGHAGDGNLHVGIMLDPADPDELAVAIGLADRLVEDALARGGTATGEHGIGLGKRDALELEHPDLLGLYRGIKELFDPRGIMNPGKVYPCPGFSLHSGRVYGPSSKVAHVLSAG